MTGKRLQIGDCLPLDRRPEAPLPAPAGPQTPDPATIAIQRATKTVKQWTANVAKLRAEIEKREASGRGEMRALKQARERLAKAERRQAEAAERLDRVKVNTFAGHVAGRRAPARDKKELEKIAREEAKRIAKRKKALERRTTKDLRASYGDATRARFGIGRRKAAAPIAPEDAATWPTGPIVPHLPTKAEANVDRPGLLPGDFRLVDRVDNFDLYRPPKEWFAAHVGDRMAEAHRVLLRLPMKTKPKEFGVMWPEYVHVGVELAYQAGAGTLRTTRAIKGTTADEVARMTEAMGWPLTFLKNDVHLAFEFNRWAFHCATRDAPPLDGFALEAARKIAEALNKGKVKVT